jgi:hypothetical protein
MTSSATISSIGRSECFELRVLRNNRVELAVVPGLGAKVVSLKNLSTGREWMACPPQGAQLFRNRLGDDFAASTLVGWDECLPTIAPCRWKSRALPDHGEVWSAAWDIDAEAWQAGELTTAIRLPISPFVFRRTIALFDREIQLHYTLTNTSDASEEFLWAMHPLLAIEDGDSLELSAEVRNLLAAETWIEGLDFGDRNPACAKTFAARLTAGMGGVLNSRTGDRLAFHWDTAENDTLGLWLSRGGWNGQHHLALEPTNGMPDALDIAAGQHCCGLIPARGAKSWHVRMVVGP